MKKLFAVATLLAIGACAHSKPDMGSQLIQDVRSCKELYPADGLRMKFEQCMKERGWVLIQNEQ